ITAQLTTVRGATLSVQPAAALLSSLTVSPSAVSGPLSATGTITLSGPAPSGGAVVSTSTTNTIVTNVPQTVTIAQGQTTANFEIKTKVVTSATATTISASF